MGVVSVVDETTGGRRQPAWALEILEERISVRELIRRRVFQEVAEFHARQAGDEVFHGLVQPGDAERELNGFRVRPGTRIDPEAQSAAALAAFERNGFVVLVGDRQAEDLDDEIPVASGVEVTFLKLVALVGG